jgi:hypothetical protein
MQPFTRPAISASLSGVSTMKGYSTRQSVASVTCETRDRPSNLRLSAAVCRPSTRRACLAQVPHGAKVRGKGLHRLAGQAQQFAHQRVALGVATPGCAAC